MPDETCAQRAKLENLQVPAIGLFLPKTRSGKQTLDCPPETPETFTMKAMNSPSMSRYNRSSETPPVEQGGEVNTAMDAASEVGGPAKTTIVSFVLNDEDGTSDECSDKMKIECEKRKWSALTVLLSILYALILTLTGTIFPITEALRGAWLSDHAVGFFLVYIFTMSTAFLIYLQLDDFFYHRRKNRCKVKEDGEAKECEKNAEPIGDASPNVVVLSRRARNSPSESEDTVPGNSPSVRKRTNALNDDATTVSADSAELNDEVLETITFQTQTASLGHEAASIYLRMGALLFGIGNLVYVSLELEYYVGSRHLIRCIQKPLVYPLVFHLVFLVLQTFFILKNTKVHIRKRQGLARFGFLHILATNLCVWIRILVREVQEGLTHEGENHSAKYGYHADKNESLKANTTSCINPNSLLNQASPFLFPFVLEYSLIAVAVTAGMFQGLYIRVSEDVVEMIRKTLRRRRTMENRPQPPHHHHHHHHDDSHSMFDKSHRGLFLGVLVLTGCVISIILFFYNLNNLHREAVAIRIFHITDIAIHVVLLGAVVAAFVKFRHLFYTLSRDNTIDNSLLILSFGGMFLFEGFIMLSSAAYLVDGSPSVDDEDLVKTVLALSAGVLNILQALFQTVFVITGLQRFSGTRKDRERKPGRGVVTFLLISNVALWIFKTFQVKEIGLGTQQAYYGSTPWAIIFNINLPLMLFYRFHSSVCLADIWSSAYESEHDAMGIQHIQ